MVEHKLFILIQIHLKYIPKGAIYIMLALV